jgi:hypothetical protein
LENYPIIAEKGKGSGVRVQGGIASDSEVSGASW